MVFQLTSAFRTGRGSGNKSHPSLHMIMLAGFHSSRQVSSLLQQRHFGDRAENQRCRFRKGLTKTELYKHRRWLEAGNFRFRKLRNCTICVVTTKEFISFAVTVKLICS